MSWSRCRSRQDAILYSALNNLREKEIETDVIIVCGQKEFKVHKLILISSSPYFEKMLEADFAEAKSHRIEMPTIDEDIMADIINFMYSHAQPTFVDQFSNKIIDMFAAAQLTGLECLADYLWDELMSRLSIDNCLEIWKLTRLYDTIDATNVLNFVVDNISDIRKDEKFLEIDAEQLRVLVTKAKEKRRKVKKEFKKELNSDNLVEIVLSWVKKNEEERTASFKSIVDDIELNSLTTDKKKQLMSVEPLFYNDAHLRMKLVELPIVELDSQEMEVTDSLQTELYYNFLFFGHYYERTHCTSYICNSALQVFSGKKEKIIPLPFTIKDGMSCVRWKEKFLFIGGERLAENLSYQTCSEVILYDMETNTMSYKNPLAYSVTNALTCVANQDTLYVVADSGPSKSTIQYSRQLTYWDCIFMHDERAIAVVSINDLMYIVSSKNQNGNEYCLHYIAANNNLGFLHRIPFLQSINPRLIIALNDILYWFNFESNPPVFYAYDRNLGNWTSSLLSLEFRKIQQSVVKLIAYEREKKIHFVTLSSNKVLFDPTAPNVAFKFPFDLDTDLGIRQLEYTECQPKFRERFTRGFKYVLI